MNEINLNDPNGISEEIIRLARELETESELLAKAELAEDKEAVFMMNNKFEQTEKRMSVAESEKRALVNTFNKYHELKYKREAKIELLNAYKKRIEVLSWEFKGSNT